MSILSGLLTFVLVINCLMLIGLVLIQLPKKDAGAGLAFGAGAADALFGAGSGNALTMITKWATVSFLVICLGLGLMLESVNSIMQASEHTKSALCNKGGSDDNISCTGTRGNNLSASQSL